VWAQSPIPKSDIVQLGPEPKERDAAFRRRASVDYAVREKLMNFASAATEHPAFARSFLVCLRSATYVFGRPKDAEYRETDGDEFHYESPVRVAERVRQFATIKDLLTTDTPASLEGWRVSHPESPEHHHPR